MKNRSLVILSILSLFIFSCQEEQKYPTDKKYWTIPDYENVIRKLKYGIKADEKLPTFDNPETSLVLEKLTDEENFKVVLDDKQLGLKHKSEVAKQFFDVWKGMSSIYTATDRTDKYVYEREFVEIENFGLELEIKYFKLGNDEILEKVDNPNATNVTETVNSNINTLVNNMMIYLDEINKEKSYSNVGLDLIASGIDKNFTELLNVYPNFNYDKLLEKVDLMLNKTKSENIKQSLTKLKALIESKNKGS